MSGASEFKTSAGRRERRNSNYHDCSRRTSRPRILDPPHGFAVGGKRNKIADDLPDPAAAARAASLRTSIACRPPLGPLGDALPTTTMVDVSAAEVGTTA